MTNVELNRNDASHLEVTDANFQEQVLGSSQPVLVDFWAAWCGPCRRQGPEVESLAADYAGRAKIAKLDVDTNPETAVRYQIRSIPTLIIFKDGKMVEKVVGLTPKSALAAKLDVHLN